MVLKSSRLGTYEYPSGSDSFISFLTSRMSFPSFCVVVKSDGVIEDLAEYPILCSYRSREFTVCGAIAAS
jgi:hypothetical protein